MLDAMAVLAQGLESSQPLVAGLLVVLPEFVAVQAALTAAYPAAIAGSTVDAPA